MDPEALLITECAPTIESCRSLFSITAPGPTTLLTSVDPSTRAPASSVTPGPDNDVHLDTNGLHELSAFN